MFTARDAHQLPPDTQWAKPYRCRHAVVENAPREELSQYVQRCMCGAVAMGLRCPTCDQTY